MELLNREHFERILEEVLDQAFGETGKGNVRHGGNNSIPLSSQTWKYISDQIGSPDFCVGQAIKKLSELKGKPDYSSWKVEILGALVYSVFAAMYEEYLQVKGEQEYNIEREKRLMPDLQEKLEIIKEEKSDDDEEISFTHLEDWSTDFSFGPKYAE